MSLKTESSYKIWEKGDVVHVEPDYMTGSKVYGEVRNIMEDGEYLVQMGTMTMRLPEERLTGGGVSNFLSLRSN